MRNARAAQSALRFAAGPSLIPELDGQAGLVFQFARKLARVLALPAGGTAHVDRIADKKERNTRCDREFPQRFDIIPPAFALHGFQTLRRDSKFVAEREADALLSEIESKNAASPGHDSIVFR